MTSRIPRGTWVEALGAGLVGILLLAASYSAWFPACCARMQPIVALIFAPAFLLGWGIGGGVHGAGEIHYGIGAFVEFTLAWLLVRCLVGRRVRG